VLLRALLLFLLFLFLARAFWRLIEGVVRGVTGEVGAGAQGVPRGPVAPAAVKMTPCQVCGTFVVPDRAIATVSQGKVVHFCSDVCRATFAA
jgi:hypothetical protein